MSNLAHPGDHAHFHAPTGRAFWIAAIAALALAVGAAIALPLLIDNSDSGTTSSSAVVAEPGVRADGGPDESAVAAGLNASSAPVSARPDEAAVAAAVAGAAEPVVSALDTARPDEGAVAAAVASAAETPVAVLDSQRPDESRVAGAVAGR